MSSDKPDDGGLKNENVFERFNVPFESPVAPEQLGPDDVIQFRCHKDIACFNACCKNIDITLTPYDIARMARRLNVPTWQVMLKYTMPYDIDAHGMPGVKMRPVEGGTACQFVTDEGCSIYGDRPTACRYYAMGTMQLRRKEAKQLEDVYFMVKEPHCLGHDEPRTLTVAEYRQEQGVDEYDEINKEWMDIVIKKKSAGPTVGAPSERSLQLFSMLYDLDAFRLFTQSEGFQAMFDIDAATRRALDEDDKALLRFGARFVKQILFGEHSIALKSGAREKRYSERKDMIMKKHQEAVEKYRLKEPPQDDSD